MSDSDLKLYTHFAHRIEQSIRMANQEVLSPEIGHLDEARIVAVAVEVSKRRAAYMKLTLSLGGSESGHPSGEALRDARMAFEEARDAFAELMHTIERGYIALPSG